MDVKQVGDANTTELRMQKLVWATEKKNRKFGCAGNKKKQ